MIYALITFHWIADFVGQTDQMAKNKSSSNEWLLKHVTVYTSILWLFAVCTAILHQTKATGADIMCFALVNGAAHFAVDYVTSRMSSALWKQGKVHDFFVIIGFDQALHMATLVFTMNYWLVKF